MRTRPTDAASSLGRLATVALLVALLPGLGCSAAPGGGADAGAARVSEPMLVAGTIYLARHAETEGEGQERPLSNAGERRARALADRLEAMTVEPVQRIFSTDTPRTRSTAAPLAERLGLPVESYDPEALPIFAERLKSLGQTVLVVGHSNTTPRLVELLGGAPGPPIDEATEFDRLYRVEVPTGETAVSRYGD